MPDNEHPAFEFHEPSGHVFRVFASGRTEGFPESGVIINRIPMILEDTIAQTHESVSRLRKALGV